MITERLLKDLAPLDEPLWLVIDDLHELGSDQARRQLELLVMRAPAELRFVLTARHDVRLGLHRLRLEGELTELRADDLRFSLDEARALFVAARVELAEPTLEILYDRTEGWAAGLRLAALSLAGHPDPERFAAEFSGTERTVAEYLLAEVLDRQPAEVRRLLLRTSILERVNGELADLLTGGRDGERVLQDLEAANAFVTSLNVARSWFPVEAVRHAQAAPDWGLAARLLADHWPGLYLGGQIATVHALVRLQLAGRIGNLSATAEQARRLLATDEAPEALDGELRALALISLGNAETWTGRPDQAEWHLEQAVALARRIGRPYLEFMGLVFRAQVELPRCAPRAEELSRLAIEVAERHGWIDDTFGGLACNALGSALAWQGRPDEAATWVQRAERAIRADTEPVSAMGVQFARGLIEIGRGRAAEALAAFRAAERLAGLHPLARPVQAWLARVLVRLGETERAEQVLAGLGERDFGLGQTYVAAAVLQLARDDPYAATAALAPVLDGSAPMGWRYTMAEAFLLEAIARDALGDPAAAGRALDLAGPDGTRLWFLLHPAPGLLERQARQRTAHAALITQILDLMAGRMPALPAGPRPPLEPLSNSEIRVLRYLPTHLTAPEIAAELSVSTTTIKTHLRHLYAKLGVHRRAEAVESARTLGLLAPSRR